MVVKRLMTDLIDSAPAAPSPLDEHGELIEWTKMIRMRYPGSWSTMSSRHKQRVN